MDIPDSLLDAIKEGNLAVFVGAGLSGPYNSRTGYPTSREFSEILAEETVISEGRSRTICDLVACRYRKESKCCIQNEVGKVGCDYPLFDISEYYEIYAGSSRLMTKICKTFGHNKIAPQEIHRKLWQLPRITEIFTTNFDTLIERGLSKTKARAMPEVVVGTRKMSAITTPKYVVYKLHGCAKKSENRSEFVITRNDYLNFTYEHPLQKLRTQYVLTEQCFLFLGYSLADLNFELLFLETMKMLPEGRISCYAVLKEVSNPIIDYWRQRGLIIIREDAEKAVDAILESRKLHLYTREDEWKKKLGARDDEKDLIATRAYNFLNKTIIERKNDNICIILDSGTTTLKLAQHIVEELEKGNMFKNIKIITNCTEIIHTLDWLTDIELYVIGGRLRVETKALIHEIVEDQITETESQTFLFKDLFPWQKNFYTFAFMGTSCINEDGFKTNTNEEVNIKKQMIKAANKVIFLADHSKFRAPGKYSFAKHDQEYIIITDRPLQDQLLTEMYRDQIIID